MSYFVQKKCEQLPGGQAVQQIIKLTDSKLLQESLQLGKDQPPNIVKLALGTKGSGLFVMTLNLTTYESTRSDNVYL